MNKTRLVRIIDVHKKNHNTWSVVFYHKDTTESTEWKDIEPRVGDIFELCTNNRDQAPRLIGRTQDHAWAQDSQNDAIRWRQLLPHTQTNRMQILHKRHHIRQAIRHYFNTQSFIEIDTPLLVCGTTPDCAVESFKVGDRYLVTSTEYQMKRLAIGGFEKIYSLTQNFRIGDESTYRNPEFTMLEWGRVGQSMHEIETDAEELIRSAMHAIGLGDTLLYQGKTINMKGPWKRLSVAQAIYDATGIKIDAFDAISFAKALRAINIEIRDEWHDQGDFLFSLLIEHIQPQLGHDHPVFLTDWPLYQTTSAAHNDDNPTVATRSELFIAGIELSDGFAGLADPILQEQYFMHMQQRRHDMSQQPVEIDKRYLSAMRLGAPYGAGMALGFDRLVMLLTDQAQIRNVLTFNWDEV